MSTGWKPLRSLRHAFAERVDARISKALETFAARTEARNLRTTDEALAGVLAELDHLAHRLDMQVQLATIEIVSQLEQSIALNLEIRSQLLTAELGRRVTYEAEARGQIAEMQAIAYADGGILTLSKAFAAASRAVVQLSGRLSTLEQTMMDVLQTESSDREGRDSQAKSASPQPAVLQSQFSTALTKTVERIDDIIAQHRASER